ncbi:MAG: 16S rRNA (guanine(966)-N(2))-methyltransferase RsmD [Crocinitomicaceae bacterium]|nr:16S rRNA (guanine(966)-N(2))-methyltransferase RsmD [Crocinitomicaceae bacterium]
MRIIGGKLKGRRLQAPKNLPVRPTTDFAKEALFNVLNHKIDFENTNLLDLFSGTGNISYEFASRACPSILSVEQNNNCIRFIKKTSEELGLSINTVKANVFRLIAKPAKNTFNVIFADPPYENKELTTIPDLIFKNEWLTPNGLLIVEHGPHTSFESHSHFVEERSYGHVHFSFFE